MIKKLKKYYRDFEMSHNGFLILEDICESGESGRLMYALHRNAYTDSVYTPEEIRYYYNYNNIVVITSCFNFELSHSFLRKWNGHVVR